MKNKHIDNLKVFYERSLKNYKGTLDKLAFDRITELTINFKNYSIDINECYINLLENGCLEIDCFLYGEELFTAYKNKDKVLSIVEKGILVNIMNTSEILNYIRTYKKYKIKSVTGSSRTEGHWVYILKPCLF